MENPTTIAVDLSKDVFEIAVEREGRICQRKRLNFRQTFLFFSICPPAIVVMEACGSAHFWGRKLQGFGHTVRLLPAQHVAKLRIGGKTDRRDTQAMLEANRRKDVVPVPVKTIEQQVICSLHRLRAALMKTRTARLNLVRGLLREFGVAIAEGAGRVGPAVVQVLSESPSPVPEPLHAALLSMTGQVRQLETRIAEIERQLSSVARALPLVERLETIPGIGLLNATALTTMVGNYSRFPTGRRFASSLGLVPKERSRGKRRWLGSISKEGDTYLRTLLIGGALSVLNAAHRTKRPHRFQAWALEVERRRGRKRAAVALANKLARIVWAVATRGAPFRAMPVDVPRPENPANAPARTDEPNERDVPEPSRPRTRRMQRMSSVRPTRGKADNSAGPKRPLFQRLAPRARNSFWPGAHAGSTFRGRRYDCRRDPLPIRIRPSEAARPSPKVNVAFLRRRKSETAPT
jgi:transposase